MNKRKRILFLLGEIPEKIENGQILLQFLIIKNISKTNDCFIAGHYKGKTFLDSIEELKEKTYLLKKNSKINRVIKTAYHFSPPISVDFVNDYNISLINLILKKNNISNLHSIFFPSLAILSRKVEAKNNIMTAPDLYSKYYLQLIKNNEGIKKMSHYFNYLAYLILERKNASIYNSIHFVNFNEVYNSNFDNAVCVPLLYPKDKENYSLKKKKEILFTRGNRDNTLWFIKNIVLSLKKYNFTIISKDMDVLEYYRSNISNLDNLKLLEWVNDYEEFTSSFYIHIAIDKIATGCSTKTINAFKNGNLLIGTELSYRGLKNLDQSLKCVFKNDIELIKLIGHPFFIEAYPLY